MLTTSAVFLSTQPPLTSFLPYTTRTCYILALGSFAHALGGLLSGLAVVNVYEACDRIWAKDVCNSLTALMRIHKIAGPDGHTLSTVLYTSVHQLADYIPHNLYLVFDVMRVILY